VEKKINMKIRYLVLIIIICGCYLKDAYKGEPSDNEVIERVKGYWSVQTGKWISEYGKIVDSPFLTPPSFIEITEEPIKYGYWIKRLKGNDIHKYSFYRVISHDTLYLEWSTGYSGLSALAKIKGDTIEGIAESFWDMSPSGKEKTEIKLIRQ
jgi:hypothetical protein